MSRPTISFEFFPPKTDKADGQLRRNARSLAALNPSFMTVTFGAGGSTRSGTLRTLESLRNVTSVPLGCHLTYIGMTKADIDIYLDDMWSRGITRIVALRGDMPADLAWPLDPDAEYYQFTSDFVTAIRKRHPFDVSVGAYPETHPDAPSAETDIIALKKKCEAGADRAITQFFFDNRTYYRFIDRCRSAGIKTPIVPGLLPVYDFAKMLSFADKCKARVPDHLYDLFKNTGDSLKVAEDLLLDQVQDLMDHGVPHIHFYTLNRADLVEKICRAAGL